MMYGDNTSKIHITQKTRINIKEEVECHVIPCHQGGCGFGRVPNGTHTDRPEPADICTKVLPGGRKQDHLIQLVLYNVCNEEQ
jgi:hypothetical protein